MERPVAARFSFLLSIPILFGTTLFKVPDLAGESVGTSALVVGFLASLVTGYLAIAGRERAANDFSWQRIAEQTAALYDEVVAVGR